MSSTEIVTIDHSLLVGTQPVMVYGHLGGSSSLSFLRIWNVAASGGATIWLSRTSSVGVNQPGSYPLLAGTYELFTLPQAIPTNPLYAIATATGTPLTVELG